MNYRFHHLGIPTNEVKPNERYSQAFKMYTSDHNSSFKIQFHRFEEDSPLHQLIKALPHLAFVVENLSEAIIGKEILLGPYEPVKNYKVAIINDNGVPVELIETTLSDEEIWHRAASQQDLNTDELEL